MNKAALTKHEIYNKLSGLSEKDLASIANFVDFMRHQKKLGAKKVLKLQGIIKGQDIDLSDLKQLKKQTWQHVEQEFADD
jgi:ABC-type transporter Mla MlaB component